MVVDTPLKATRIRNNIVISTDITKSKRSKKRNIVVAELRRRRLSFSEVKAHARLFSAAPDLLDALESVVKLNSTQPGAHGFSKLYKQTWAKIHQAIDKATSPIEKNQEEVVFKKNKKAKKPRRSKEK